MQTKTPGKLMAKAKLDTHAIQWKTVPSAGVQLQDKDKTVENSVTSEASRSLSKPAAWENLVLKGAVQSTTTLSKTHNLFFCDSIHNTENGTPAQCHTDSFAS